MIESPLTSPSLSQPTHSQIQPAAKADATNERLVAETRAAIAESEAANVVTSVSIQDLRSQQTLVANNTEAVHFGASIMKMPMAVLILEDLRAGKIKLTTKVTWSAGDVRAGAGIYDRPGAPTTATVADLLWDMLHRSGNTPARVLVNNVLGGALKVNERWKANPNLSNTYTQIVSPDGSLFYLGYTTPTNALYAFTTLISAPKDAYQKLVYDAMRTNTWADMGVRSQVGYAPHLTLVNKIGLLDDPEANNRHDIGLIFNNRTRREYAYVMMTSSPHTDTTTGDVMLREVGQSLVSATQTDPFKRKTKQQNTAESRRFEQSAQSRGLTEKQAF